MAPVPPDQAARYQEQRDICADQVKAPAGHDQESTADEEERQHRHACERGRAGAAPEDGIAKDDYKYVIDRQSICNQLVTDVQSFGDARGSFINGFQSTIPSYQVRPCLIILIQRSGISDMMTISSPFPFWLRWRRKFPKAADGQLVRNVLPISQGFPVEMNERSLVGFMPIHSRVIGSISYTESACPTLNL